MFYMLVARKVNNTKMEKSVYINCSNSELMSVKFGMQVTSDSLWQY